MNYLLIELVEILHPGGSVRAGACRTAAEAAAMVGNVPGDRLGHLKQLGHQAAIDNDRSSEDEVFRLA
ncbi:MAG: hypothetical protein OER95_08675 [Acidimicrobiia bacterium]|nr:hypothetical protein [Acidimicrobiia bacterium]